MKITRLVEIMYPETNGDVRFLQANQPDWVERWPYRTLSEAETDGWEVLGPPSGHGQHGHQLLTLQKEVP